MNNSERRGRPDARFHPIVDVLRANQPPGPASGFNDLAVMYDFQHGNILGTCSVTEYSSMSVCSAEPGDFVPRL